MDLSVMDSDMIYATVYQMMSDPEQYVGKTFRIEGKFYVTYDEMTKNQYYYCVIKDATECCAQGLESYGRMAHTFIRMNNRRWNGSNRGWALLNLFRF